MAEEISLGGCPEWQCTLFQFSPLLLFQIAQKWKGTDFLVHDATSPHRRRCVPPLFLYSRLPE